MKISFFAGKSKVAAGRRIYIQFNNTIRTIRFGFIPLAIGRWDWWPKYIYWTSEKWPRRYFWARFLWVGFGSLYNKANRGGESQCG